MKKLIAITILVLVISISFSAIAWHLKNAGLSEKPNTPPVYITLLTEDGGRVGWSKSGNDLIVFDRKGEDGYFDIYTMRPDGTDQRCLTDQHPFLPGKHIGNPEWHPSGEFIVFQAEKKNHPNVEPYLTAPGVGYYNDLYVMSDDGVNVWQLTNLTTSRLTSVLHPHFSHDGTKLVWSETLYYQVMALKTADFVVDENGPRLENITIYQPGENHAFYESHGFSPDDTMIIFSAALEPGIEWTGMDIYTLNLETQELTRLTDTPDEWDEHAHYSPDGEHIIWMSSKEYPFDPDNVPFGLRTELWMMNADGSNKTRLTYFNDQAHPEYTGFHTVVGDCSWNSDGTKIVLKTQLIEGLKEQIHISLLEFNKEKPYVFIEKPVLGYLYIFNREWREITPYNCRILGKITIEVTADDEDGIEKVEFYIDDELKNTDFKTPYEWKWRFGIGNHVIKAVAYDNWGNTAVDEITVWKG